MNLKSQAKAFSLSASLRLWVLLAGIAISCSQCKFMKNLFSSPNSAANLGTINHAPPVILGWNLLFAPGSTAAQRNQSTQDALNALRSAIRNICPSCSIDTHVVTCPCDTLLTNIDFTAIDGTGQSVTPPPGSFPPTGGSGNPLVGITYNIQLEPEQDPADSTDSVRVFAAGNPGDQNTVLGIMDTGLDPTLIPWIRPYLWKDPDGPTLYNFLENPGMDRHLLKDDHLYKHGTVVTNLALMTIQSLGSSHPFPRIMVLKVLDKQKKGSTFSVSCGMSYAIQHQAAVVNASLGYYPADQAHTDTILEHYIRLAGAQPSPTILVAAAGNTPFLPGHDPNTLCDPAPGSNQLSISNLFLPACDAPTMSNVISVTGISTAGGINDLRNSCHYQNYSGDYISVGVVNHVACCKYFVPFRRTYYEGSSFATPVFSGYLIDQVIQNRLLLQNPNWLSTIAPTASGLISTTRNGQFIFNPSE